ncbi:MAG: hypothetical protein AAF662_06305 [Pseudomonadota bacterium]
MSVDEASGVYDNAFGRSNRFEFAFDDTKGVWRWIAHSSGSRLFISQSPTEVYIDSLNGGAVEIRPLGYTSDSTELLVRDPRVAGYGPIAGWGLQSLKELLPYYHNTLKLEPDGDRLKGRLLLEASTRFAADSTQENFRYFIVRDLEVDIDKMQITKVLQYSERENGKLLNAQKVIEDIEYANSGDMVVPVRWRGVDTDRDYDTGEPVERGRLVVSMEWKSVNEGLGVDNFLPEGIGLPGGTLVVDRRHAVPLIDRKIPRNGNNDLPGGIPVPTATIEGARRPSKLFLWLNIALVSILAIVVWVRRMRKAVNRD